MLYLSTKKLKKYLHWLNVVLVVVAVLIVADVARPIRAYFKDSGNSKVSNGVKATVRPLHPLSPLNPLTEITGQTKSETQPFEYYAVIMERNLFGSGLQEEEQKADIGSLPQATLKLALKGTVIGGILYPRAIIEDLNTKREEVYRLGDVVEGAKIVEVQRDRVVFKKGGETWVLLAYEGVGQFPISNFQLPISQLSGDSGRIEKTGENRWRVYRSDLWEAKEDRLRLLAQVRISPYLEEGRMAGFRISDIDEVSIINQVGVKDGDVIEKVNGERIDSIAKALEVYEGVKDKPRITVDVLRDGKMTALTYEIQE